MGVLGRPGTSKGGVPEGSWDVPRSRDAPGRPMPRSRDARGRPAWSWDVPATSKAVGVPGRPSIKCDTRALFCLHRGERFIHPSPREDPQWILNPTKPLEYATEPVVQSSDRPFPCHRPRMHGGVLAPSLPMPAALCLKSHLLSLSVCMVYQVPPLLSSLALYMLVGEETSPSPSKTLHYISITLLEIELV